MRDNHPIAPVLVFVIGFMFLAGCAEENAITGTTPSPDQASRPDAQVTSGVAQASFPVIEREPGATQRIDFTARTKSQSGRQFVDLSPEQTGIDLTHVWDPPPLHRSLVSQIFGTGVALGDFDNDSLLDVFVARQTDAGRLYRNLGNMQFADVTEEMGIDPEGMWTFGTTFVDLNNDGKLDLYLCGQDCPNRLYINNGHGFDERAAEYGLDFHGASIEMTFADYDRDGDLDGYLVTNHLNRKKPKNQQFVTQRPGLPPKVKPEYQELVYLLKDADGKHRRIRAGQFDHFFRNDNGTFVDATEETGIGLHPYIGLSANWWDYNGDGWPDLYVANDYKGPDFLYRNNGPNDSGHVTFTNVIAEAIPHTPWYSMGSDFADINNDGRLDYMSADMAGTNHYRDKLSMGNMSGPDSQAWFLNQPNPPQYMRNSVYLNTGTERFMEIAFLTGLAKTDWTWTTKFADLDNDGWQDVYFTNGMMRDVLNSDHAEEFRKLQLEHKANGISGKEFAALNYQFWQEKEPYNLENMAFQNQGDLKFKNVGKSWGLDHLGVSTGAAVGDLDNDGDLDLITTGFEERVHVYRNDVAKQRAVRFQLHGVKSNRGGLGARVEIQVEENDPTVQVRYLSASRGFMSTSENIAHFGIGDAQRIARAVIRWPSGTVQELKDLETGALYHVTESEATDSSSRLTKSPDTPSMFANTETGLIQAQHEERDYDDFERQPLLPNKYSQLGPGMAWGDVDGDGDDDFFQGAAGSFKARIYENLGGGDFRDMKHTCFYIDAQCEDMGAMFFDADGDKDLDLYVVSGGVECGPNDDSLQDRIYLNDGSGQFKKSSDLLPEFRSSGGPVAACDFDADGDLDVVVGGRIIPGQYPETPRTYLLLNTGSGFEDATVDVAAGLSNAGMVTGVLWSDVDGDHWTDLLVTCEWGPVRFFKNESGTLVEETESAGLASRLGWYNSICGGDIDNDGDTDFVVGNCGLNTKYKASVEKPELLFYGDFEGQGRNRIVEAKYENGVCLPRRGLSCSSHAMPMVKEKLPTFHEFAISSLDLIYTEEKLETARRYEANSLESGILINDSENGRVQFRFVALPRITQASPIFGSQLCDVDGDGNLDLYVVQNFYGPQRETGYMDGGVSSLLMGDGQGKFTNIDAQTSGLLVTGDATSLSIIDFNADAKPDFVVGKNNEHPLTFENRQSGTYHHAVRLPELAQGKSYWNAKIWAEYSDGSIQLIEIPLSQGYLTQSGPTAFLGKGGQDKSSKHLANLKFRWSDGSTLITNIDEDLGFGKSNK